MPEQAYDKLSDLVKKTGDALKIRIMASGDPSRRAALERDLELLESLADGLARCRPAFRRAWGLEEPEEETQKTDVISSRGAGYPAVKEEQEQDAGDSEELYKGPFFRLPKGGVIQSRTGDEIFVPEIWVRNLGLEHGDEVSAVPLGTLHDSVLYEFTVERRAGLGHTGDRVAFIGPVTSHGGEWMVYSVEEDITVTLKPKEVHALQIREGDLVEVAYPRGDISQARIAWKYEDDTQLEYVRGRPVRPRRDKTGPAVDVADPLLSGRRVLVVGADLYKDAFRQMFERRGAKFSWESGFQGGMGRNIESKVRGADIVVIVTEMMSHRLPSVEAMCGRFKKPFVYAPSKGATGAIRECQKILSKGSGTRGFS